MVIFVLVVIWVAALLPFALRKRSEWLLSSSVSQFRQRNRALSGAYPRLAAVAEEPEMDEETRRRLRVEQLRSERARIRRLRDRRRRALTYLGAGILGSFLLGAIPPLRALWDLSFAGLVLAAGYGAVCYRMSRDENGHLAELRNPAAAPSVSGDVVVPLRPRRPAFVIVEATP